MFSFKKNFQSALATADRHFHRVLSVFLRYANEAAENDEDYRSGIENIRNPVVSSPDMFERIPIQISAPCRQNPISWPTLNARLKSLHYNELD